MSTSAALILSHVLFYLCSSRPAARMTSGNTIQDLALGPEACITAFSDKSMSHKSNIKHDLAAVHVIVGFNIPQLVPLDGEVSYAEIAQKVSFPEHQVHRIPRHAMTSRIFHEPHPGYVAHTGPSAAFLRNPVLHDWVSFDLDEVCKADAKLVETLRTYGDSKEPADSAIGCAFGFPQGKTYWDFIANDGEGRIRAALGKATVVDVGGSAGHVSIELAKVFPDLEFVIQDFEGLKPFHDGVPGDLKPRISFEAQDILQPNAHPNADVYLLRSILHDWSDKYAVLILKNSCQHSKTARGYFIGPENTQTGPIWLERLSTIRSMQMMTMVNAPERSEKSWISVIKQADSRYSVRAVVTPAGTTMSDIEIVFNASG
ncbi:S-adenosyl-L-methionine-dependent methyltransferase [Aspergillus foveolatus]|uniref:S-adenosyl-L-methionine-dependent methyltransferase n=1 Tax=Aspergillus foveolatus TaxID=210207 RepID=UPI003CCDDBF0